MMLNTASIGLSVRLNDWTGGPRGWSLCARLWEARLNGNLHAQAVCKFIDNVFFNEKQHCREAWLYRSNK